MPQLLPISEIQVYKHIQDSNHWEVLFEGRRTFQNRVSWEGPSISFAWNKEWNPVEAAAKVLRTNLDNEFVEFRNTLANLFQIADRDDNPVAYSRFRIDPLGRLDKLPEKMEANLGQAVAAVVEALDITKPFIWSYGGSLSDWENDHIYIWRPIRIPRHEH